MAPSCTNQELRVRAGGVIDDKAQQIINGIPRGVLDSP